MVLREPFPRRYSVFFSFFFLAFLSAQGKYTVVLDAGHGGEDTGASRSYNGLGVVREKDVSLDVVLKLGELLEREEDIRVIYTRTEDVFPSLTERTNKANKNKADLFISVHCNSSKNKLAYGSETFVQGPSQNRENLEVAKAENDVIYLDGEDQQNFAGYDQNSPESLIALKIQQSRYLEKSLLFGGMVEGNFEKKGNRFSRGVKQSNLHVLRMNAMPSVLIEIGFISNEKEAAYLASEFGKRKIAESIHQAVVDYKKLITRNVKVQKEEGESIEVKISPENTLKNDFRILLMTSAKRYKRGDPQLQGLKYVLTVKEGAMYKYYYSNTNLASTKKQNLKTAKEAGFKDAVAVGFVPNLSLADGYYRIEVAVSRHSLKKDSHVMSAIKTIEKRKENGVYYYTYGRVSTLEGAVALQKKLAEEGITDTVIEKVMK